MNTNEILNAISTDADMNTLKEIIHTAQRRMKAVKAEHADSLGSNYETHPSYAMLSFTRSSSTGIGLFGSSIPHENVIRMVLKRGSERRINNESWYCGEDTIASVEMSYSQFAEAISSLKTVICTYRKGKQPKTGGNIMEQITRKDIDRLAKEYGCDAGYLMDVVLDLEGDGILVTAGMIEDYILDGTI